MQSGNDLRDSYFKAASYFKLFIYKVISLFKFKSDYFLLNVLNWNEMCIFLIVDDYKYLLLFYSLFFKLF